MDLDWLEKISKSPANTSDLKKELAKVDGGSKGILNQLMTRMINECDRIEIFPVAGYEPYGFHVKLKVTHRPDPYDVYMIIIPKKTEGIKVRLRHQLTVNWERVTADKQLFFEKTIGLDDIDRIINHCKAFQ